LGGGINMMIRLGGFGGVLAAVLSWIVNQSLGWAVLHFFCSWIYVVYWALMKSKLYDFLVSLAR
jgi:hypothetical protein